MFSDVKISGVSFGEETQNIGNINTVEVLDYNLSKSILTFLSTVSVDLSHKAAAETGIEADYGCLLYTSPSPRDLSTSRMPSSA